MSEHICNMSTGRPVNHNNWQLADCNWTNSNAIDQLLEFIITWNWQQFDETETEAYPGGRNVRKKIISTTKQQQQQRKWVKMHWLSNHNQNEWFNQYAIMCNAVQFSSVQCNFICCMKTPIQTWADIKQTHTNCCRIQLHIESIDFWNQSMGMQVNWEIGLCSSVGRVLCVCLWISICCPFFRIQLISMAKPFKQRNNNKTRALCRVEAHAAFIMITNQHYYNYDEEWSTSKSIMWCVECSANAGRYLKAENQPIFRLLFFWNLTVSIRLYFGLSIRIA